MNTQLTFGLMSGETKFVPYAAGDKVNVVRDREIRRYVVTEVIPEAYARPALRCIRLDGPYAGNEATLFEDEITYRSKDTK